MGGDFGLIWGVLLLPVAGFLLLSLLGKRLEAIVGRRVLGALAVLPVVASFVLGVMVTQGLSGLAENARHAVVAGPEWINLLTFRVPFELVVDPLSMTMTLIITGIGSLIFLYSTGYMAEEREYARFFTYLNLFVAAMLLLVLGNNLALLFVGWEGVGLCSYLLIGFWYKDLANARAANKAFIVNRVGDWGLTLGIFLIFAVLAGNRTAIADGRFLSYDQMLPALYSVLRASPAITTAIALLLFVGAAGKSAQFPLYLWLPDAMAGPTPVSALIHAATMVTSGVVLLNRMHVVFEMSPVASAIVCAIGAFTAIFAALIAFGQTDIKKVLAYSTVSQLGYMFIGCGAGAYWTGMFHVTTHAFFKALLFLGAGAVIHAMAHNQDMRNYGRLSKYLPITTATMVVGWLAIAAIGIPGLFGLSGYYSKEVILGSALAGEHAVVNGFNVGVVAGWIGLVTALLTAWYMTRMTFLTFFGKEERWRAIPAHAGHDVHGTEEHAVAQEENPIAQPIHTPHGETVVANAAYDADRLDAEGAGVAGADMTHPGGTPVDPHGFYLASPTVDVEETHHELDRDHRPHEVPFSMSVPLIVLALLSAFGGWALANGNAFEHWLAPSNAPVTLGEVPVEYPNLGWISLGAAVLGIVFGLAAYAKGLPKREGWNLRDWNWFRRSAQGQFGFDNAMTTAAVEGGADVARGLWVGFDEGVVDRIVNGLGGGTGWISESVSRIQRGFVRSYALWMLVGAVFIFGWFAYAAANMVGGR